MYASFTITLIALALLIISIAFASDSHMYFLYSMTIINGFFSNSCIPLCFEILAETSFPISETLSAGLVHALYALIRLGLKGLNKLLDSGDRGIKTYSYSFILILLLFSSFVVMFFAKIKHRRLRIEVRAARKEKKKNQITTTYTSY